MDATDGHVGHIGSRRRTQNKSQYSVEEQALDQIAKEVSLLFSHVIGKKEYIFKLKI